RLAESVALWDVGCGFHCEDRSAAGEEFPDRTHGRADLADVRVVQHGPWNRNVGTADQLEEADGVIDRPEVPVKHGGHPEHFDGVRFAGALYVERGNGPDQRWSRERACEAGCRSDRDIG